MTILTVGTNAQFQTIHAAVAASQDGDTIYVQAGTYTNDVATINHKISIIGVGGMVKMVATKPLPNDKGFFIVNNDATIDHFEFSGAKSSAYNGAGIRYQGGTLTVTNSYFHDNENGILAIPTIRGTGTVIIDHSEFAHNGHGDGQSHNMYIGPVDTFQITNSYTHDAVVGHEIKTRALNNIITNNRIDDGNGTASYSIDITKGGNALVADNVIRQGPNSQNHIMIAYMSNINKPTGVWSNGHLTVENNVFINAQIGKATGVTNFGADPVTLDNNTVYGLTSAQLAKGLLGVSPVLTNNHLMATAAPAVDTAHPWSASTLDNIVSVGIGDDVLVGTAQKDLFVGGVGQDVFVITPGGGSDVIADFNAGAGAGDVVQLQGTSFKSFAQVQAAMTQHGTDVQLDLGKGEILTFKDVNVGDFAADDFTFTSPAATSGAGMSGTSSLTTPTFTTGYVQVQSFDLETTDKAINTISGSDLKNDLLKGTSGADMLDGKKGADTMQGGLGDDHYIVDNAKDVVTEKAGEGIDLVRSTIASYTLGANVENLTLGGTAAQSGYGNALNNILIGSSGDSLYGMGGDDILNAGKGGLLLSGGTGHDIFEFDTPSALSKITDFTVGQDLLDLSTAMRKYTGSDPVADHALSMRSDGHGGTIIAIDPTHTGTMVDLVDVQNVAPTALHMGYDYIF